MKSRIWAASLVAMIATTTSAEAQDRFAFEVRGGAAFPTEDVGTDELGTGLALDATLRYRFMPHLAAYVGWDWVRFSPDASPFGASLDFEETGYVYGLRFEHPIAGSSFASLWLRGGGTYDHIEVEDEDGDVIADSGHGAGWEAAGGLALALGERWSVTPGVRYRSLSRPVDTGAVGLDVDLRYVAAEIGFAVIF